MKTYKGFDEDMTCKGFQYEEGKSYEKKEKIVCENGFHVILSILVDTFISKISLTMQPGPKIDSISGA